MMISTRKYQVLPLVYLSVKLSLILLVAIATCSRKIFFSAMNIKSSLCNCVRDKLLNDWLVPYIENDIFVSITNENIMQQFQNMKT